MKALVITISAVLLSALGAYAQTADREAFPEQVSIDHNQVVKTHSSDFVISLPVFKTEAWTLPTIDYQRASITQMGDWNTVKLTQIEALNYAEIATIGNSNVIDWYQIGRYNWIKLDLIGHENKIDGNQVGNDNLMLLNLAGNGLIQSFEQLGNEQYIEFYGVGIPMSVTQRGNGAAIIIENR